MKTSAKKLLSACLFFRLFCRLLPACCWLALLLAVTPLAQAALDPTRDKILYLVANAHLDDQWNWTIQDTINTYIPATLHTNFAFFETYPHYTFNWEEAWRYQLVQEYYPADFLTLSNYVAQGRWRLSGAALVASDVNTPSPESLIRQALLAENYYAQTFGKTSLDIFLPDCFGFGYALPSIAAHCGVKGFSSQKLSWGCWTNIPFANLGRWIGPDGASVLAVLQPGAYTSTVGVNLANDSSELTRMTNNFANTGLFLDYLYFGTGDTGGGPTPASVNWVEQSVTTTPGAVNVLCAGADQIFRDLAPTNISKLPTYQGELLMRIHGNGTYTAHSELKTYNRKNEQRADAAERVAVIADWLQGGGTYPQERLNKAWTRFLWNQFHDVLTGTSIPEAYPFTWNDELLALNEFGAVETYGVGVLARALDTTAVGVPLVVYNPLSIAREDLVEANVTFTNGMPAAVRVYDSTGAEVPSQLGTAVGNTVPVTFLANVPATGAAVYDVRPSVSPCSLATGLSVSSSQVENARYRVQLNASGDVTSIWDKVNNRQLLNAPIRWAFLYNLSTSWPCWEIQYSTLTGTPTSYLGGTGSPTCQVLENGPARVSLGVTRFNAGSAFTERIRLAAGGAGDRVEWDVSVNWGTLKTLLKVTFPLAVTNSTATFDLGLGTIQRGNANSSLYEVPAQQWADLTHSNNTYGVSILNDCKYGWDKPDNSTLRLTIFHTPDPGSSSYGPYEATNSIGTHRFTFAVMGHTNDWRSGGSCWTAARLNQPLQAFQALPHAGTLGRSFNFLSCNNPNVMVKAVKKAENSNEIIVRLQELTGSAQMLTLRCAGAITAARQVSGTESPLATLSPSGGALTVSLGAYSPLTLALTLAAPGTLQPKPSCSLVTLPYNLDAFSTDANRTSGNFDNGYTYPAELMPATIVRDGITFKLGPTNDGALNALACQGQAISFNGTGYDHLYLLAAAASNATTGTFTVNAGGVATNLTVPYFTGFIGQWNAAPALADEVAWVCTHRHDKAGANNAYNFCYLFKYRIDLPPDATSLVLPNAPNLRIFAMTLATNTTPETFPVGGSLAANQLPWAHAGPNRLVNAGTGGTATVVLDASGSGDPDGSIVSYAWSTNGIPLAAGVQPTVALPMGTNTIVLTVTDNQGGTSQDMVTLTVLPPLQVTLGASTNRGSAPLTVQFTGSAAGVLTGSTSPDTTDDGLGTVTARGENSGSGEIALNAFDNDSSTKWLDFSPDTANRSSWIQYQYANALRYLVTNYTITSANDAQARDPSAWRLLGSNDGGTTWATLDIRTNQVFPARFQKLSFSATNTNAYNLYRLQIDKVYNPPSANSVQLAEMELIGAQVPTYVYSWSFGDGAVSSAQNPLHTFTNNGSYRVILAVSSGLQTGTNSILITVGAPLVATMAATPRLGATPLSVQFTAQASGGNGARSPYDTTDDARGSVTAQGDNPPSETMFQAFDNDAASKWLDFANAFPSTRSTWIQYQYDNARQCVVSQYSITSGNDATAYPERSPKNWRLLASNDGNAWTTLDTRTNQTFTASQQKRVYSISNTTAYNAYRLQVDSVFNPSTANSMQLDEVEFIGLPAYSYLWSFGDGASSAVQNPQHTYMSNGTYLVTLVVSDGAAFATNSTTVSAQPLVLGVTWPQIGQAVLSWPAWAGNCSLYAATNLAPPVLWSPVTNAVVTQNGTNSVSVTIDSANRFFQLRSP